MQCEPGGEDHDFVRRQQLVHRERRYAGRNAQLVAQVEEVLARDAREDKLVRRGRAEYAVADDGEAGMCALGDAVAAMEYDLVAAGLDRALHRHAVRDEVERLDVAVQETGVLDRDELVRVVLTVKRAGLRERHQGRPLRPPGRRACGVLRRGWTASTAYAARPYPDG